MASSETIAPVRPKRWKILLLCGVIFCCGVLTGGGLTVHLLNTHMRHLLTDPELMTEKATNFLTHRLDLCDDQVGEVRGIIGTHHRNIMEKRKSIVPYVKSEMKAIRDEVAVVLDEEQKEIWLERFERMHRGWAPIPPDLMPGPGDDAIPGHDTEQN